METLMGNPCGVTGMGRGIGFGKAAATGVLAAIGTAATPAAANEMVLLDFTGGTLANNEEEAGQRGPFQDSPRIQQAARDAVLGPDFIGPPTVQQQAMIDQRADKMIDDIAQAMRDAYDGLWIEFVVKKKADDAVPEGVTRTIDFVSGVDDTAVPGSFGFFESEKGEPDSNKAWVLVDNFIGEVWVPANSIGGGEEQPEADRRLNAAELTNAIAKTTAHELGHTYLGSGHPKGAFLTKEGEDAAKPTVLDPAKTSIMAQGFNIFDLGTGGGELAFSKEHRKKLEKLLGTSEAEGHKPAKPLKTAKTGERDGLGVEPVGRDLRVPDPIDPAIIPLGTGGTDVLLPEGVHVFEMTFDQIVGGLDAAFLEIGLFGVNDPLNPGGVSLSLAGIELGDALAGFDTSPADPAAVGSELITLLLDLEDFPALGGLPGLQALFNDGDNLVTLPVELTIAAGLGGTVAVDFVEVQAFMPEPASGVSLLLAGLGALAGRARRIA